jgi:hypothetical protein
VYPMLPVALGCVVFCFSSSCVPYVASCSGLFLVCFSLSCVPYMLPVSLDCLCSVFLRLVYPMLPVSLGCVVCCFSLSCVSYFASCSGLFLFVLCTLKKNKTKTIQRNWQHRVHKTKKNKTQHNPQKLAT